MEMSVAVLPMGATIFDPSVVSLAMLYSVSDRWSCAGLRQLAGQLTPCALSGADVPEIIPVDTDPLPTDVNSLLYPRETATTPAGSNQPLGKNVAAAECGIIVEAV